MITQKVFRIGIRREDKSVWERRTPLIPADVKELLENNRDIQIIVQPSKKRVFSDCEYKQNGAIIQQSLDECDLILGIKEVPVDKLIPQKTYMIFSHTIKAQPQNMPALDKILEYKIRLIDYQKITDQKNNRLIAFGKYAGIAGAIDFLKGFGEYIMQMGISTPFLNVNCSYKYFNIQEAYESLKQIGVRIKQKSIPEELRPMIFAVTGRGRTANGCFQVLKSLPITYIKADQVQRLVKNKQDPLHQKTIYVVNVNSQDVIVPRDPSLKFDKQDYYPHPGKYRNTFYGKILPYITALFHCIYWDKHFPRYIKNRHLKQLAEAKKLRLLGICDITCDLNGSIECLKQYTKPQKPFFYFDSLKGQESYENQYQYGKIVYLAIDFLPSELAYDASLQFSSLLKNWVPNIAKSDSKVPLQNQSLFPQLKRAIIAINGELTQDFKYIQKMRQQNDSLLDTMTSKEQPIKTQVDQTSSTLSKNVSIIPIDKIIPQALSFADEEEEQKNKKQIQKQTI